MPGWFLPLVVWLSGVGPAVPADRPPRTPEALAARIDGHLAASFKENKAAPVPRAGEAEFLRRAYLDLVGRIPTVAEARRFLDDEGADLANRRELMMVGTTTKVEARFLDDTSPDWSSNPDPRRAFADWLTRPGNPSFAPVMANRVWANLFGVGLVDPVDDWGPHNLPSHPRLLDDLAAAYAASGFDSKFLVRAITASDDYQRTSRLTDRSQSDPRAFARMNVKGLSAEQLFDSLATATGTATRCRWPHAQDQRRERPRPRPQSLECRPRRRRGEGGHGGRPDEQGRDRGRGAPGGRPGPAGDRVLPARHRPDQEEPVEHRPADPHRRQGRQAGAGGARVTPSFLRFIGEEEAFRKVDHTLAVPTYYIGTRRPVNPQHMPKVDPVYARWTYRDAGLGPWGRTDYAANDQVVLGGMGKVLKPEEVKDGLAETILVGEKAMDADAVKAGGWYWDEPIVLGGSGGTGRKGDRLLRDAPKLLEEVADNLGSPDADGVWFLFCDGHTRLFKYGTPRKVIAALISPNGNDNVE
jgi:hypothetical protein